MQYWVTRVRPDGRPPEDGLNEHMQEMANEGWELVTVTSFTANTGGVYMLFWQRR